jgi:hypothetical protein
MIIGLHGESRAGKDSVAQILVKNYWFTQKALATPIRNILLDLNPWLRDNFGDLVQLRWLYEECDGNWDMIKAKSKDSVEYMIRLGQSARDNIHEDVWIESAFPSVLGGDDTLEENIVVSDIRQPNEVNFIKMLGGELWLIERPGTEKRGMDGLLKDVKWDVRIANTGTLEDLSKTVQSIMNVEKGF